MVRVRDYGGQKGLRRLDNERKSYRPLRLLQLLKLAADRFGRRYSFQKLPAYRFFH